MKNSCSAVHRSSPSHCAGCGPRDWNDLRNHHHHPVWVCSCRTKALPLKPYPPCDALVNSAPTNLPVSYPSIELVVFSSRNFICYYLKLS